MLDRRLTGSCQNKNSVAKMQDFMLTLLKLRQDTYANQVDSCGNFVHCIVLPVGVDSRHTGYRGEILGEAVVQRSTVLVEV
jgi:hypothetical protein